MEESIFYAGTIFTVFSLIFLTWFGLTSSRLDLLVASVILTMTAVSSALIYALTRYGFKWQYAGQALPVAYLWPYAGCQCNLLWN